MLATEQEVRGLEPRTPQRLVEIDVGGGRGCELESGPGLRRQADGGGEVSRIAATELGTRADTEVREIDLRADQEAPVRLGSQRGAAAALVEPHLPEESQAANDARLQRQGRIGRADSARLEVVAAGAERGIDADGDPLRSEERRVGKE